MTQFLPASPGKDRRALQNTILLGLPKEELASILPKLEHVPLPLGTLLNEAGEAIKFAYFLNEGLGSVLTVMMDGKSVEVGLSGKEGFVGIPLLAGFKTSHVRVIMQVSGHGLRISTKELMRILPSSPALTIALHRYSQQLSLQSMQVAACNRLHDVEQRLARWLLMSQDRIGGDVVPLTQQFLAHMLGTRRASVTVAAGILQKASMITYSRGTVVVTDRARLESAACECYKALNQHSRQWYAEIGESNPNT